MTRETAEILISRASKNYYGEIHVSLDLDYDYLSDRELNSLIRHTRKIGYRTKRDLQFGVWLY